MSYDINEREAPHVIVLSYLRILAVVISACSTISIFSKLPTWYMYVSLCVSHAITSKYCNY